MTSSVYSCHFVTCIASVFTGSPFSVKATGEGRIRESITRRQKAASVSSVGSVCDLNLKIPGMKLHIKSMKMSSAHLSMFRFRFNVDY